MEIKRKICPAGLKTNPNRTMKPLFITIHCTGNYNTGATAKAHADLQYGGGGARAVSWHYTVDRDEIWQSYEDTSQCWHAGDGGGLGNATSIGIEICVNSKAGFLQACKNAALLAAALMKKFDFPIGAVRQHHSWSGKNCPEELRSGRWGIDWNEFLKLVEKEFAKEQYETITKTKIRVNGVIREVETINKEGYNFIKLRDLQDGVRIAVGYIETEGLPTLDTR